MIFEFCTSNSRISEEHNGRDSRRMSKMTELTIIRAWAERYKTFSLSYFIYSCVNVWPCGTNILVPRGMNLCIEATKFYIRTIGDLGFEPSSAPYKWWHDVPSYDMYLLEI